MIELPITDESWDEEPTRRLSLAERADIYFEAEVGVPTVRAASDSAGEANPNGSRS